MIRSLMRSTLFTYTTLFRSMAQSTFDMQTDATLSAYCCDAGMSINNYGTFRKSAGADLKTTRPNFSHQSSSYAVLLFKKISFHRGRISTGKMCGLEATSVVL